MSAIQLKRSTVAGRVPTALLDGETALNVKDAILFWKDDAGTTRKIDLTSDTDKVSTGPIAQALAAKAPLKTVSGAAPSLLTTSAASTTDKFAMGLAAYRNASASVTGAIVFLAPPNLHTVMHHLKVLGYNYATSPTLDCSIAGFRSGPAGAWQNVNLAHYGVFRPTVRLARKAVLAADGSLTSFQNAIIVGDVNTVWSFPHVSITAAMFSHTGATDAYTVGWTTELTQALDAPVAGGTGYDLITTPSDVGLATKLDGALVSTFARTLVDDTSAAAMRTTLQLGGAAILNVGTAGGTVAAGNDARMTGALRFDVDQMTSASDKAQARSNLGVQSAGTYSVEGLVQTGNAVGDAIAAKLTSATARATLALGNPCTRRPIADAAAAIAATDNYVCLTSLTARRILTLPAASAFPPGHALYVADESGACGAGKEIDIVRAGSDTIAGQTSVTMASPYQKLVFHSNGSNLWTV